MQESAEPGSIYLDDEFFESIDRDDELSLHIGFLDGEYSDRFQVL